MSTHTITTEKLLVYDGDCPMCTASVARLLQWGLVRADQVRANHDLSLPDLELAEASGIRNEIVAIDVANRRTRVGFDALLWTIVDNVRFPSLLRLLGLPGMRQLMSYGYRTISYNRRIISPPKRTIACACDPEVTLPRRLMLIVPLVVFALAVLWLLGVGLTRTLPPDATAREALAVPAIVGAAWLTLAALGIVLLPAGKKLDYVAHLTVTMFAGALVMLPAAVLSVWLPRAALLPTAAISTVASLACMFLVQRKRAAVQQLSATWLWVWLLMATAGFAAAAWWFSR